MAVTSHRRRTEGRLPRGPHHLSSEEVAAHQRERLIDAMVTLVAEGHTIATVADVIERAGVSRKTFYAHFPDREALLRAAFDATSPAALEAVRLAARRKGGPTRQLEAVVRRLCRVGSESPGTIALSTIEIAAIDPAGAGPRDALMDGYGDLIDGCLRTDDRRALPPALAQALAGSTLRTIDAHLRTGRPEELSTLARELARWVRSYHPVPPALGEHAPLTLGRRRAELAGGRAPGTLTLAPGAYRAPSGIGSSSAFVQHANRERILDAVAELTTMHGYAGVSAQSIAEHADLSERAFLAHFKSKDDAFSAAAEVGQVKGQAIVQRVRASAPDWATGVRDAVYALFELFASEPRFTRLAFVDAPLAGPGMVRRAHEHAVEYAHLLLDGAPQRRRPPRIAPEAVVAGLFELALQHAVRNKAAELLGVADLGAYLALAPFVGVAEAAQAIVPLGGRRLSEPGAATPPGTGRRRG
jgi:AcrR family transcriptional regulator